MKKLLVVILAFNEEKKIERVISSVPKKIRNISMVKIVVVDDGSTDRTADIARVAGAEIIKNPFNVGLGLSFNKGLQYALDNNFDVMVNIDGDGQFNARDISKLVLPVINGEADFVTASRFIDKKFYPIMPIFKFWGNKLMSLLVSQLTGRKFYDVSCGFRAYSQEALLALNLQARFTYTQETFFDLAFKKFRILEIPIRVKYFPKRKSRLVSNFFSYGFNTTKVIFRTYRDYRPLLFFSSIAAFFFLWGSFFEAILLGTFIKTGRFSPNIWSGFVGAFFLFLAMMFFIIGLLADMNTRIRLNQEKILYLLKKKY